MALAATFALLKVASWPQQSQVSLKIIVYNGLTPSSRQYSIWKPWASPAVSKLLYYLLVGVVGVKPTFS